jgi:hypothetical protein
MFIMALKKSEKRLLVVLGIAVGIFILDRFVLGSSDKEEAPPAVPPAAEPDVAGTATQPASVQPVVRLPEVKEVFKDWGRDPFVLGTSGYGTYGKSGPAKPKLKGFLTRNGRSFVLIDHVILTEGEEQDGIRVEKINGMEVLCRKGSRSYTLSWRESP